MLAPAEVDGLFAALRSMAAQGLGIIFISHKLNEVRALTHRCVVLRQGRVAGRVAMTPAAHRARDGAADVRPRDLPPPKGPSALGGALLPLDAISTAGAAPRLRACR